MEGMSVVQSTEVVRLSEDTITLVIWYFQTMFGECPFLEDSPLLGGSIRRGSIVMYEVILYSCFL